MHLAILVTNTDLSDFAHRHPFDAEKFETMVHSVRPDWTCTAFRVHLDEFPPSLAPFDGIIITGSPASVHDTDPWVGRLLEVIRNTTLPLFGACYGHQAIALALGGTVGDNPHGWSLGLKRSDVVDPQPWMAGLGGSYRQFAAHKEQVTALPDGAQTITSADGVPCAGFVMGRRVYTTQNHPEISPAFFEALLAEFGPSFGADVAAAAKASMTGQDDNLAYAESIAAFFEQAVKGERYTR
ncbi:type 1 glutamine amidotransferase [Pseudooctadecabacter jejudonensis]|uniref:GMP synthase [glutamine-hydrolyzing] n=1 Tax=Pseudooctadecabacter jejudonensis TaxID=1391910 RepID=A0A1Y5RAB0_9RHOB|nr:type 1 glutamine amidotransferase [Pseudooctadecabacter jejudonensis]SLN10249.1 GMP synthase [glutamine-hydrolyzing] [Pseudooctadecabacter jejudonensis]